MDQSHLLPLIDRYKKDPESVYNTWFLGDRERIKAFRAIRRGVGDIVESIRNGTFGSDFKGSPLEVVLEAITEQKQVFEGAAHPFYWKPKLRIPDIYEDQGNKQKFAACLDACHSALREDQVLAELSRLAEARIKGLGPSLANIIYFLHPTFIPPFNTAMVNGFNALFGEKRKLGSWTSFFGMREIIVRVNDEFKNYLSKDLGAFAGLLFEIGSGRFIIPGNSESIYLHEREHAEAIAAQRHVEIVSQQKEETDHTHVQFLLIKIGRALKYDVYVARNDRHCSCEGESFALLTVPSLPKKDWSPEVFDMISLIDVIWIEPKTREVVCAFEVEKSTSIYSGILRMEDLARSMPERKGHFYIVAPHLRGKQVLAQFRRPSFREHLSDMSLAYISFENLRKHFDALCKFGADYTVLQKITTEGFEVA